uniref:hypothetical protein n=1 Tax=Cronobacter turicensis TaxID=413502 RepID=UPI001F2A7546
MPTLAVLAAFNRTPVRFTGIDNLRVKECDRVAALAQGLKKKKKQEIPGYLITCKIYRPRSDK